MQNASAHEDKLFSPELFKTFLSHEVNKSRRYGNSLSLIDLLIETNPANPETQRSAELYIAALLNLQLRDTDIRCKMGNEFLILMPSTGASGARTACERVRKLMEAERQTGKDVSFQLAMFFGIATLPIDRSISSNEFTQNASQALQHARINQLTGVVVFSDLPV